MVYTNWFPFLRIQVNPHLLKLFYSLKISCKIESISWRLPFYLIACTKNKQSYSISIITSCKYFAKIKAFLVANASAVILDTTLILSAYQTKNLLKLSLAATVVASSPKTS
ncbi:uncharacterized protein DS421_5g148690 [Arachis hypogaea]|nr:uncharacterized protein DS421_5g148690 [Arachis hypogaea]